MYMDDIKVFAKNKKEMKTIRIYSLDTGREFDDE